MGDCGSFVITKGQGTSKNLQGRRELGRSQFIPIRSLKTHTKNKASKGTFWSLGLLGEGDFLCGAEIMISRF